MQALDFFPDFCRRCSRRYRRRHRQHTVDNKTSKMLKDPISEGLGPVP